MKVTQFKYPTAQSVVICGDIHGDFAELVFRICTRYKMTDTLVIVAGDCRFGFEKQGYYDFTYRRIAKKLSQSGNWIAMVRGNHDNPEYFNKQFVNHERFRCIPDYSVIEVCNNQILCVGGAISIDRKQRKAYDSIHLKTETATYWENEMPIYVPECLEEIRETTIHPVRNWFYGHFHQSWNGLIEGTEFSMLNIMELKTTNND